MPSYYPTSREAPALSIPEPSPRFRPPAGPADIGTRPPPAPVKPGYSVSPGKGPSSGFDEKYKWFSRYMQGYRGRADYAMRWRRLRLLRYLKLARLLKPDGLAWMLGEMAYDYVTRPDEPGDPLTAPAGYEFYYDCLSQTSVVRTPATDMRTFSGYNGFCGINTYWAEPLPVRPDIDPQLLLLRRNWYLNRWNFHTHSVYNRIPGTQAKLPGTLYPDGEAGGPWGRDQAKTGRVMPEFPDQPIIVPQFQTRPGLGAPNRTPLPIWSLPITRPSRPSGPDRIPGDSEVGNGPKPPPVKPPGRPPTLPRPPGRGVKERKGYARITKVVAGALDTMTEIMDAVEIAWDAIDKSCVRKKGGKLDPSDKAKDVYRYYSCINMGAFLRGLLANGIEDILVGKLFSLDSARRAVLEKHFGYYPSASRLVDIALAGGLPIDVQEVVDYLIASAVNAVKGK
jgi:hypothetical protein